MEKLLSVEGICKAYPGVQANDQISFSAEAGRIHALLGENGAGKSTLVKIIYGLVQPDSGRMRLNGEPYRPQRPLAARAAGVAMVFQHFSLFDAMTVEENIALGMENPPGHRELSERIRAVSSDYGLPLEPRRVIADLSVGERQRVEIVRCLLQNPRLFIMDEPTSVLTPQEVEILFRTLRQIAGEGAAILYISHKLEEIRALCDQATILRQGRVVDRCDPRGKSAKELAETMVGNELKLPRKAPAKPGKAALEIKGLSLKPAAPMGVHLRDVSLEVRAGEVVGIAGVAGNGQDELLGALSGESLSEAGSIFFKGRDVSRLGPNKRRMLGMLAAPEERLGHAAAGSMSLAENALLTGMARRGLLSRGFIRWKDARSFADEIISGFSVSAGGGASSAAKSLSGGNLQKFVIGREALQEPEALVVNQPTWGVDASAAAFIRQKLMDMASRGAAVVVISQDLDELMEISDRFAALNDGRLSEPAQTGSLSIERIGLMMGGASGAAGSEEAHAHA